MAAPLFFTYGFVALLLTWNALRPPSPPSSRFPPLWLPAMITSELAPVWLVVRIVISAGFVRAGALSIPMGWIGLGMVAISELGLGILIARTRQAMRLAEETVGPEAVPSPAPGPAWRIGLGSRAPGPIELSTEIPYHDDLTLDLYRSGPPGDPAPCLIYVHGGGWTGGSPHKQSRPLFWELARRGWIVATIRYPLSPKATFPDHLIGIKRAIAWTRTTGIEWGIDPDRLLIAGGSAGAHLASLAALTPNQARYQPGFTDVDTSLSACISMYGVYDFFNRNRTRHDWPVIPKAVMKATPEDDPDRYRAASPIDQVGPQAPPFLVVHGSHDSLVPPAEAHHFVEALRSASSAPISYIEVPGGQHAFDAIDSPRTRAVVGMISEFADRVVRAGDRSAT